MLWSLFLFSAWFTSSFKNNTKILILSFHQLFEVESLLFCLHNKDGLYFDLSVDVSVCQIECNVGKQSQQTVFCYLNHLFEAMEFSWLILWMGWSCVFMYFILYGNFITFSRWKVNILLVNPFERVSSSYSRAWWGNKLLLGLTADSFKCVVLFSSNLIKISSHL